MDVDRGFEERNARQRRRLRSVAAALRDDELVAQIENGWTVAMAFAHLAFWDRQRLELMHYWEAGGATDCVYPGDVMNAALAPLLASIAPRVALQMALEAADEVDEHIASRSDQVLAALLARPNPPNLERGWHREHHLDQIARAGMPASLAQQATNDWMQSNIQGGKSLTLAK